MSSSSDSLVAVFSRLGLDVRAAESTARSVKIGPALLALCTEAGVKDSGCDKQVGVLLLHMATKLPATSLHYAHRQDLLDCLTSRSIRSVAQLEAACDYLRKGGEGGRYSRDEMERVSGVGMTWTEPEMLNAIRAVCDGSAASLSSERYRVTGKLLAAVNSRLPWADGRRVKELFDAEVEARIGKKSDEPTGAARSSGSSGRKVAGNGSRAEPAAASSPVAPSSLSLSSPSPPFLSLPVGADGSLSSSVLTSFLDSLDGREIAAARNTPEQLAAHEQVVPRGRVRTRFPPEPNGVLHLGHSKAMNFNFGLAAHTPGGSCLLRFDDTNPEAERLDYIEGILANVAWLGHRQSATTYSSDYFPQLYELAVKLIGLGHAYVDHQTAADIRESRDAKNTVKIASPWRDRPIHESLTLFEDMRKGKFDEGAATLRMKGDLSHPNPQMWDLVAYRIKYLPHPHVGDRWCIYPSYDYTHCIIDSIEHITHSCCTLEFEVRRESYYWLLDVLGLYKPKVWEYSRLNVEHNVMSKRRLLRLVEEKLVSGWDDPRLLTLDGLRRRGYTPRAITDFCNAVGISRNETMIPMQQLEHWCRNDLETTAKRVMVVLDPVEVLLTNYPAGRVEQLTAPDFPKAPQLGSRSIPFSRVLWIERADVRLQDDRGFFGLAPNKEVHLKYAYNIRCDSIDTDPTDPQRIVRVRCSVDVSNSSKPKGKIHWVAEPAEGRPPLAVALRLYDVLFKSVDPMALDDWLSDLNPHSLQLVPHALAEPSLRSALPGSAFQFERVAFFVCDQDSRPAADAQLLQPQLVFNRTVTLKESKPTKGGGDTDA